LSTCGIHAQVDRYQRIGAAASVVEHLPHPVALHIDDTVDASLVVETVSVDATAARSSPSSGTPDRDC
jgi:hypothetical protein